MLVVRGLLCAGTVLAALEAAADPLPVPSGDVVLTITGSIAETNADDVARFDLAMLQDLTATRIETTTIWTEGPQVFEGVSLIALIDALGAEGSVIAASALNDYTVEIPLSDAIPGGPILAYAQNGEPLSVRDKGPLWVVYPYDSKPEYQSEVIYARSIWQVKRMEIR
ncbi:MAG: molybdopterin-dependent oxidoreductase [Rhodobacteraceae bacterium]|nr:molybdopterin-dependent oxidoreductase [Paracoccaceae bacterium]